MASGSAALGSTSGSSAAVLDASCACPMDGQVDAKTPDFIVFFFFSLICDYTFEPLCTISYWFGRRGDGWVCKEFGEENIHMNFQI